MVLTKQEVVDWKNDRVTKHFLDTLADDRDRIADDVIMGSFTGKSVDETAQLLAREIGKAQAIQSILDFAIEDMLEGAVEDDDED